MKSRVKDINDPRYKNIQNRFDEIIEGYIKRGQIMKLKVRLVSARARVNPSTFYNHYTDMDEAVSYSNYRMYQDLNLLKSEIGTGRDLEVVYMKILFFVYKNRRYYDMVTRHQNIQPLTQIIDIFRPLICEKWQRYKDSDIKRIFLIYQSEFAGVIMYWAQSEQFKKSRIHFYAKELTRLSQTACQRLR